MVSSTEEAIAEEALFNREVSIEDEAKSGSARAGAFVATVLDQGFVSLANFAIVVLIGRKLGPSGLGIFTLLWSSVLCVNVLQQAFFVAPMLTLRSRFDGEQRRAYFGAVGLWQLAFALASSTMLFVGTYIIGRLGHFSPEIQDCALPLAAAALAFQIQEYCRRAFQACKRLFHALVSDVLAYAIQLALVIATGAYWPTKLTTVIWCMALGWSLGCIFLFGLGDEVWFERRLVGRVLRSHVKFGAPLAASSFFQWCGAYGALYLAAAALHPSAIGNIRAIITIAAPLNVFALGIQTFLSIEAADVFRHKGLNAMRRLLVISAAKFAIIGLVAGIGFAIFSKQVLGILFGAAFSVNAVSTLLMFISVVLGAIFGFLVIYFKTVERTRFAAFAALIATIVSLVTLRVLLRGFGSQAVFISLVVNQMLACLLGWSLIDSGSGSRVL